MASVGISIPLPEPGTSPVSSSKVQQYESLARRNSSAGSAAGAVVAGARLARKRSCSFHSEYKGIKRRRHGIVPPTKFLLGGNICDPLNLGSLNDEEANRIANANTPVSSPVPTPKHRKEPIEVIIPSDISDPLGLNGPEEALLSPSGQRRKRAKKKKKHPSGHTLERSVSVLEPTARVTGPSEPAPVRSISEGCERSPPASAVVEAAAGDDGELCETAQPEVAPANTPPPEFQPCPAVPLDRQEEPVDSAPEQPQQLVLPSCEKPAVAASTIPSATVAASASAAPAGLETPSTPPTAAAAAPVTPPTTATTAPSTPTAGRGSRPHSRKTSAEIVSPALPQPGARPLFPRPAARGAGDGPAPMFRAKDAAFQYGNYNRYYGYRNPMQLDPRLGWLKREWFCGLDVLDVGCNVGHVTLTVARDYQPRRCVGIDIDSSLIKAARRNVKHYQRDADFPSSLALLFGDLVPPYTAPGTQFPRNVSFVHGNYVLECDALLETVTSEYDTILCLSVTKWVHLNYGDAGLRRFLRRAYLSLRPGGRLLLEPQPWASYLKKKKLTPRIWDNFQRLRLRPETFPDLLVSEIGFERYQTIGRPHHSAKGFSRQLLMFIKAAGPCDTAEAVRESSNTPAADVVTPSHATSAVRPSQTTATSPHSVPQSPGEAAAVPPQQVEVTTRAQRANGSRVEAPPHVAMETDQTRGPP